MAKSGNIKKMIKKSIFLNFIYKIKKGFIY